MGVGHLGASLALRARCPRLPLFYLLRAGVLVDVLWGIAVLFGLERARIDLARGGAVPLVLESVPYTHSLVACVAWGVLAGALWWGFRRDTRGGLVLAALVVSHWMLDVVSHVADVPLLPGGPLLGLGLWRLRALSLVVELAMLGAGLALYALGSRARDRIGSIGIAIFAVLLPLLGAGAFLGPPPASVTPLAAGNVALVALLGLLGWVDEHRRPIASASW